MGIWADRGNRKLLLGFGLLLNGVAFVGLSYAPNFAWAIGWCIVAGLAGSSYHPAATAMVVDLFPYESGKALGRVGIGAGVGFWLGPTYAGWRGQMEGWRTPMLELGMLGILGAILFFWFAPNVRPRESHSSDKGPLFVNKKFALLIVLASIFFGLRDFGGAGFGTLMSLFMQRVHDLDAEFCGKALGWMFLASALSNPILGSWSDRFRFRLTGLVLTLALILIGLMWGIPKAWILPALIVYGFFFLSSYPMVEAALMGSVPERIRGRVFGFWITVGGGTASFAHWAMGNWVHVLPQQNIESYRPLFIFLASLILVSLLGIPCLRNLLKNPKSERV
jgi:MFS family permease